MNRQIIRNTIPAAAQSLRYQTNAATGDKSVDSDEWQKARPLHEMPTETTFNMIRSFFPGAKYANKDISQLTLAIRKDYGDIFLWPSMMGRPPVIFTHNFEDFQHVYRNEGIWPMRPGQETLDYYRSVYKADRYQGVEGLLSTQGEKWSKFRSAVNPVLMQPKNVLLYLQKMSRVNMELIERIKEIRDPKTLEVPATFEEEINRWALESIAVVALDTHLGLIHTNRSNPEANIIFSHLTEMFQLFYELEFKPSLWKYISTPKFKRLMTILDELEAIISVYVDEAKKHLEDKRKQGINRPENEKSVLEKLLRVDEKVATVMAADMLLAGVDTTTTTFTGIMLCLAKNPEKQEKLRAELRSVLPKKESEFTESSIKNLPFLRACIKESLRIYPLGLGHVRNVQRDVVLSGYRVPKDTTVIMVSYTAMTDDKQYPHANKFLPERWIRAGKNCSAENAAEFPYTLKTSNPFTYLPFGFGPRMCIGRRIVELELELSIARIIRNFKVEFNYPIENAFKTLLFNVPNIPLKFKFIDIE